MILKLMILSRHRRSLMIVEYRLFFTLAKSHCNTNP